MVKQFQALVAACVALLVFLADLWSPSRPAHLLLLDADAVQLTGWESPTVFLLADDFFPTPPN